MLILCIVGVWTMFCKQVIDQETTQKTGAGRQNLLRGNTKVLSRNTKVLRGNTKVWRSNTQVDTKFMTVLLTI